MNPKLLFGLALILSGGLFGCSITRPSLNWPVCYDCEKGPTHLFISREAQTLDYYTNGVPDWNVDLHIPAAKISSSATEVLGVVGGLRVVQVRLILKDLYYTDAMMILEEVETGRFLPVYVQDYNQQVRRPVTTTIAEAQNKLSIIAGMNYAGTGHFKTRYKIILVPKRDPEVSGPSD